MLLALYGTIDLNVMFFKKTCSVVWGRRLDLFREVKILKYLTD